jgi:hypothetical protein
MAVNRLRFNLYDDAWRVVYGWAPDANPLGMRIFPARLSPSPPHNIFGLIILNSVALIRPSVVYAPPTMARRFVT